MLLVRTNGTVIKFQTMEDRNCKKSKKVFQMLAYTWVILKCKLVGARDINLLYVKLYNLLLGKIYDFSLFYMTWITM